MIEPPPCVGRTKLREDIVGLGGLDVEGNIIQVRFKVDGAWSKPTPLQSKQNKNADSEEESSHGHICDPRDEQVIEAVRAPTSSASVAPDHDSSVCGPGHSAIRLSSKAISAASTARISLETPACDFRQPRGPPDTRITWATFFPPDLFSFLSFCHPLKKP